MDERQVNSRYLLALREHWIYIPVAIALAIAGALAYTQVAQERYEANADILVSPVSSDTLLGLPVLRENVFGRSVVTAARLTKSPQVAERVREALVLDLTLSEVTDLITVTPQEQSDILTITGTSGSAEEAASVANAFAQGLLAERTERFQIQLDDIITRLSARLQSIGDRRVSAEAATISTRLADYRALSGQRDPTLEIVSAAVPPSEPAWPRTAPSVAIAAVIGLLFGIAIALGLEFFNPTVTRAEFVSDRDGPPVLAQMATPTEDDMRVAMSDPYEIPPDVRAPMRSLWASLDLQPHAEGRTYLVTSGGTGTSRGAPHDDEGATAVAALLASVMARAGMGVTLIDADLERRPLAEMLDGDEPAGLDVGHVRLNDDWSEVPAHESGRRPRKPRVLLADTRDRAEALPPDRLASLVQELKDRGETLVISSPPLPAAETTALAELADAVIISVAVGRTRRDRLAQVRNGFARRGIAPAGYVVLERPSLLKRVTHVVTERPSLRQRWAQ
jgi:capsular polysaccharide biosynthesis protein